MTCARTARRKKFKKLNSPSAKTLRKKNEKLISQQKERLKLREVETKALAFVSSKQKPNDRCACGSNAKYKILFGREYEWNKGDNRQHIKCLDWDRVYDTCMKIKDKMMQNEISKENVNKIFDKQLKNNFMEMRR
jgi:hypothetical protein